MRQTSVPTAPHLFRLHFEKFEFESWLVRNRKATYNSKDGLCHTCAMARFLQDELRDPMIQVGFNSANTRDQKGEVVIYSLPDWVYFFTSRFGSEVRNGEEALDIFHRHCPPDLPFSLPGGEL